jgi:hypothetical protein
MGLRSFPHLPTKQQKTPPFDQAARIYYVATLTGLGGRSPDWGKALLPTGLLIPKYCSTPKPLLTIQKPKKPAGKAGFFCIS